MLAVAGYQNSGSALAIACVMFFLLTLITEILED